MSNLGKMRKAVLFDLDDTIFDHQHCRRSALTAMMAGFPSMPETDVKQLEVIHERHLQTTFTLILDGQLTMSAGRRERTRLLFEELNLPLTADELTRANGIYREVYDAARRAVSGATAMIKAVRETMKLAVITNGLVETQEEKIRLCGVEGLFDATIIAEQVGMKKPAREIFELALSELGVKADEAIVIGDSWKLDVLGAKNAGIPAVWFNRYEEKCPEPGLAVEVTSLEPTENLVRILNDGLV